MLVLSTVLLAIVVFVLFFVRRGATLTAREVLMNYLQAVRGGRTEEAYHYLSSANRDGRALELYKRENSLGNGLIAEILGRHISFVIEKDEATEDRSTVVVAVTAPDYRLMLRDIFREFAPARLPEQSLPVMIFLCRQISCLLDKYRQDDIPMITAVETYSLLKEDGGWKIDTLPAGDTRGNPSPISL